MNQKNTGVPPSFSGYLCGPIAISDSKRLHCLQASSFVGSSPGCWKVSLSTGSLATRQAVSQWSIFDPILQSQGLLWISQKIWIIGNIDWLFVQLHVLRWYLLLLLKLGPPSSCSTFCESLPKSWKCINVPWYAHLCFLPVSVCSMPAGPHPNTWSLQRVRRSGKAVSLLGFETPNCVASLYQSSWKKQGKRLGKCMFWLKTNDPI